ncbi:unnamed protein product [Clonostachys byssicola]|uniref:F-box domain-containing protein n=1 Tax=Clonostachys byssicola TaxID=160290 RepID=A0A9N9UN34_9HYPO|nr:unnamed protein product [Clonostachys byssicola]
MPLSNTPPEIVTQIFSCLETPDLANLCLVNKNFHPIAEYALYSDITFKWDHNQRPRIIALLDTLFRRPERFDWIKALTIDGSNRAGEKYLVPLLGAPRVIYVNVVQTLNTPLTECWTRELKKGRMDAFAAILIAHTTKIRRLTVTGRYIRFPDLIGPVLDLKLSGQLPKFERLNLVTYLRGYDSWSYPLLTRFEEGMCLFHMPTVTHLACHMGSLDRETCKQVLGKPDLRNLTVLVIEGSNAATMCEILALTKNLKSLAWAWEYAARTTDPVTKSLDLDEIITALSHVKDTLESLQLRITIRTNKEYGGKVKMKVMGSFSGLREFNRITELEVPLICLTGSGHQPQPLDHCIPSGIKTISLSCVMLLNDALAWNPSYWWSDQGILGLVQDMSFSASLPQLRRINIFDVDNWFEDGQFFEVLERISRDVEVWVIRRVPLLWDF